MKSCVIFCAGEFAALAEPIAEGSLVIAADGGLGHTEALGLQPGLVLGDFDSLGYVPEAARVFPVEKDDTDALLAVREGLRQGCRRFVLYGSLDGRRVDHTVANFQTLQFIRHRGGKGYLVGRHQIATLVQEETCRIPAGATGTVSVFALGGEASGVTLKGVKYPLKKSVLTPGFPLGVSNRFTGEPGEISVEKGSLLVIWDRENGLF